MHANEAARLMKEVSVSRSEEDMKINDVEEPPMDDDQVANAQKPMESPAKTPEPPAQPTQPAQPTNKPAIDAKPTVRVRAPPGGKSSIFF